MGSDFHLGCSSGRKPAPCSDLHSPDPHSLGQDPDSLMNHLAYYLFSSTHSYKIGIYHSFYKAVFCCCCYLIEVRDSSRLFVLVLFQFLREIWGLSPGPASWAQVPHSDGPNVSLTFYCCHLGILNAF